MKTSFLLVFCFCFISNLASVPIAKKTIEDNESLSAQTTQIVESAENLQADENNNVAENIGKEVASSDVESQMVVLKKTPISEDAVADDQESAVKIHQSVSNGKKIVRAARQDATKDKDEEEEDEDDDDDDLISFFDDDDEDEDDEDETNDSEKNENADSSVAVKGEDEEEEEDDEDDIFSVFDTFLGDDDDDDDEEEDEEEGLENEDDNKTSVSVTLNQPSSSVSSGQPAAADFPSEASSENDISNSIDQNVEESSVANDNSHIKNTPEGESSIVNQQNVQNTAQAISSTNTNQGSSSVSGSSSSGAGNDNDDDDDDDDDDEDEELGLGDDDEEDDDEEDDDAEDDDEDEGDIESALLEARQARAINNDGGHKSLADRNRLFDKVVSRLNKELKSKYDPAIVKLTTLPKKKKTRSKPKKKSENRNILSDHQQVQSTLPKENHEGVATKHEVFEESLRSAGKKHDANSKKLAKSESDTKATLYGLSSLRRFSDTDVIVRPDHTMVTGKFAFGPLVLRVEKESRQLKGFFNKKKYGKGLQRDIRSATASTEEMYGTLKLKLTADGAAKLQLIKVYQPKLVRIESDGNHDKTREFLWKRSSDIAPIVSRTLSNVAKTLTGEKSNAAASSSVVIAGSH